jgi:CheY-like chemotaxis protein
LLKETGNEVRTAHDGPTAVKIALEYIPDVVLLDIGLPGLNGYEVAKQIRNQPSLKNVVLVALTGYGQESDREASMEAGFNHHLIKPAKLDQVRKILASVAERHSTNMRTKLPTETSRNHSAIESDFEVIDRS